MKKDIKWLRNKLQVSQEVDKLTWELNNAGELYTGSSLVSIEKVLDLLDELDEPEALSQEWMDERTTWKKEYGWISEMRELEVASKLGIDNSNGRFSKSRGDGRMMKKDIEWAKNQIENALKFEVSNDKEKNFKIVMKEALELIDQIDGSMEERKYYVLTPTNRIMLIKDNGKVREPYQTQSWVNKKDKKCYQLTEQEIKDYDPIFMTFAKPIEEVE